MAQTKSRKSEPVHKKSKTIAAKKVVSKRTTLKKKLPLKKGTLRKLHKKLPLRNPLHRIIFTAALVVISLGFAIYWNATSSTSGAITLVSTVEAEQMTWSPRVSPVVDNTASGGKAMVLTANSTGTLTFETGATESIRVSAKGSTCFWNAPSITVKLDGKSLGSKGVFASKWTLYDFPAKLSAGSHKLEIAHTNALTLSFFWWTVCRTSLSIDKAETYLPPPPPPPSPTPIPSHSPAPTQTPSSSPPPSPTPSPSASPSPSPTASPVPVPANSSSGQSVPIGNLPGWKQVFVDDFTKNAAFGSWGTNDPQRVVYTGDHGGKWFSYPDGWPSTYTSGKPGYQPAQVLSVHDGVLDFYLHKINGQASAANPSPVVSGNSVYQTYGRYVARLKVDPGLSSYYAAWLLWPTDAYNPGYASLCGETDFPEGHLNGIAYAFAHNTPGCKGTLVQDAYNTQTRFDSGWHTYTIEWAPGSRTYYLDGKLVGRSTTRVWSDSERWQLQVEPTSANGDDSGHLSVDWVAVYSYAP